MLRTISNTIILLFSLLIPLLALPFTSDTHEYNKMILLFVSTIILFLIYCFISIIKGQFHIYKNRFFIPLFFVAVFSILSLLFQAQSTMTSLITPLSASTLVAGFAFIFLAIQLFKGQQFLPVTILVTGGAIVSLYTILMYLSIIPKGVTTPAGNLVASGVFLFAIALYSGSKFIRMFSHRPNNNYISLLFYGLACILSAVAVTLLIYHLLTDQRPILLPLPYALEILFSIYQNPRTLLLGIGPGHFITAFTLGKPAAINSTPLWNIVFTSSSSFLFTLASELGVIAAVAYLFLCWQVILITVKELKNKGSSIAEWLGIATLVLAQIILPSSMAIWGSVLIFVLATSKRDNPYVLTFMRFGRLRYLLLIIPVIIISLLSFFTVRGYLAELVFKRGIDSLAKGEGAPAYNNLKNAIYLNPLHDRYRIAFAQTNLAIADSFARLNSTSEEDKQKIPQLVQQAIDEARSAVNLYQTNALNWENLATVYTNLINYAQGADNWGIESYQQRIRLDPKNPTARIPYGRLLWQLGRFKEAENVFGEAVSLKPDFANAWYNLGVTYESMENNDQARASFEKALFFLPQDSKDREIIENAINQLGKRQDATVSSSVGE